MLTKAFGCDFSVKAEAGAIGAFKGYASTFDTADYGDDVVIKGAFGEVNHKRVRMLWQHEGDKPIGAWSTIKEDQKGLYVEGKLVTTTRLGREAYDLMKAGALSELSIGYKTLAAEKGTHRGKPVRKLKSLLLKEISVVSTAMNPDALIEDVKSDLRSADRKRVQEQMTEREFERHLRDAGLSAKWSRIIVSKGFAGVEDHLEEMLLEATDLSCKDARTVLDGGYRAFVAKTSKSVDTRATNRKRLDLDDDEIDSGDDVTTSDASDETDPVRQRDAGGEAKDGTTTAPEQKSDVASTEPIKLDPVFLAALNFMD